MKYWYLLIPAVVILFVYMMFSTINQTFMYVTKENDHMDISCSDDSYEYIILKPYDMWCKFPDGTSAFANRVRVQLN